MDICEEIAIARSSKSPIKAISLNPFQLISGQDKAAPNSQTSPMPSSSSPFRSRLNVEVSPSSMSPYAQVSPGAPRFPNVNRSHGDHNNYDHRRTNGPAWDGSNLLDRR